MMPSSPARISSRPRRRSLEIACLFVALALATSCRAATIQSFPWKDSSGASVAFSQASSWPAGEEGRFAAGRASNRYIPARSLAVDAGQALVVELSRSPASGGAVGGTYRVKLSLSAKADGSTPFATASFPLLADRVSAAMPVDSSSRIGSLTVANEGAPSAIEIKSIAIVPAFKGIERSAAGLRVSSGFTLAVGSGYRELSLRRPFISLAAEGAGRSARRPGLLLEYGRAPKGGAFRLMAKSPSGGDRSFTLRSHPSGARTVFDLSILPADTELLTLRVPESVDVLSFYAADLQPEDYELADLGRVLLADPPSGDYSVYRWDMLPSVLIFDFKDYATQDRYLKRLAFFVEKVGYRGILAKDEDIASLHGWNAHDYRAEDLAAFFKAAKDRSFALDPEEKELEGLLVGAGILREPGGNPAAGEGAMISISRESSSALRWTLAVHESTHAIFFSDPGYRSFARNLWASLDPGEKWFWKTYLNWAGYDSGSDYLMGNEFQAYLLQQPASMAQEYFSKRKAAELLEKHPELEERVTEYMATYESSFAQRAKQLEAWLSDKYGVDAGRTVFLTLR